MKTLHLGGAALAAIVTTGAALAQPVPVPVPAPNVQAMQMHRGSMKTVTRDEVVAHVRDMFAKLDTNRDGFVMKAEAEAAHQRMAGAMHERRAERIARRGANAGAAFDRLDVNKDGYLTRQEFDAGRQLRQERRAMVMQQGRMAGMMRMHAGMGFGHGRMFEAADVNKDGRVSIQEATAAALQHFDAADLNHDGRLTPEERMQMRQQLRAQRRPA
jgi:Ca2+-binding EF-hand superfamily protein